MLPIHSLLSATGTFDIKELAVYPIKFADIELQKALRARGETFWKCRRRNYVCYNSTSDDGIQNGVRFDISYLSRKVFYIALLQTLTMCLLGRGKYKYCLRTASFTKNSLLKLLGSNC